MYHTYPQREDFSHSVSTVSGETVDVAFLPTGPGNTYVRNAKHEEAEANARLIAAAPDVLAALKALVLTVEYQGENNFLNEDADEGEENALTRARAAIAKATQP